jgi:hypothetical protein
MAPMALQERVAAVVDPPRIHLLQMSLGLGAHGRSVLLRHSHPPMVPQRIFRWRLRMFLHG